MENEISVCTDSGIVEAAAHYARECGVGSVEVSATGKSATLRAGELAQFMHWVKQYAVNQAGLVFLYRNNRLAVLRLDCMSPYRLNRALGILEFRERQHDIRRSGAYHSKHVKLMQEA